MSTLIQENGKTQEEMDVENQVNQNYHAYQGPRTVKLQQQQPQGIVEEDKKD